MGVGERRCAAVHATRAGWPRAELTKKVGPIGQFLFCQTLFVCPVVIVLRVPRHPASDSTRRQPRVSRDPGQAVGAKRRGWLLGTLFLGVTSSWLSFSASMTGRPPASNCSSSSATTRRSRNGWATPSLARSTGSQQVSRFKSRRILNGRDMGPAWS